MWFHRWGSRRPCRPPPILGTIATLAVLSVFRLIESKLPSESYAHHHLRFKRESVLPEDKLRDLIGSHGFSIANLSTRLIGVRQDSRIPNAYSQPELRKCPAAFAAHAQLARSHRVPHFSNR